MGGALPLKFKYTKKRENVNWEINPNDKDSHGIKTMHRSYPRQKLISIIINIL